MTDGPCARPAANDSETAFPKLGGLPTQKLHLILGHLYLVPWFARRFLDSELPLRPFLDANPQLELGGLPIASKGSRYGTDPPYLPSLTIDRGTDPPVIETFMEDHASAFVLKPLFGSRGRGIRKVSALDEIVPAVQEEPMVLQPYVDAPKEYGVNVMRIGSRLKIYGLTEVPVRAVWGDGERGLQALAEETYGPEIASQVENGDWVPSDGQHVPIQVAAQPGTGRTCRDVTDRVTPTLRASLEEAADQIGLRFGRFDVKAQSLEALQEGEFYVLEANGSPSLDLTLYDDRYSLSVKIERLRAHWNEFFRQARACRSTEENTWGLLGTLLWFAVSPEKCVYSFRDEVDDRELASRA
jgi:hypothetical protein